MSDGSLLLGLNLVVDASKGFATLQITEQAIERVKQAFNSTTKTAQQSSMRMSQSLTQMGFALLSFGYATGRMFTGMKNQMRSAYDEAKKYETQVFRLKSIALASEESIRAFRRQAMKSSGGSAYSLTERTGGFYKAVTAGWSERQSPFISEAAEKMAVMSEGTMNLEESVIALSSALHKFSMRAEDAMPLLDQWMMAAKYSPFEVKDFATFINSIGDMPSIFDAKPSEVFAMGAALRSVGQMTAQSGHSIMALYRRMIGMAATAWSVDTIQGPGKLGRGSGAQGRMVAMWKMLGLDIMTADRQALKSPRALAVETMFRLEAQPFEKRTYLGQKLFTTQARQVITSLQKLRVETEGVTLAGKDAFLFLLDQFENKSKGMAEKAYTAFMHTAAGLEQRWKALASNFRTVVGETILTEVEDVIKALSSVLKWFTQLADEHPVFAKSLVIIAGTIALIGSAAAFAAKWLGLMTFALAGMQFMGGIGGAGGTSDLMSGYLKRKGEYNAAKASGLAVNRIGGAGLLAEGVMLRLVGGAGRLLLLLGAILGITAAIAVAFYTIYRLGGFDKLIKGVDKYTKAWETAKAVASQGMWATPEQHKILEDAGATRLPGAIDSARQKWEDFKKSLSDNTQAISSLEDLADGFVLITRGLDPLVRLSAWLFSDELSGSLGKGTSEFQKFGEKAGLAITGLAFSLEVIVRSVGLLVYGLLSLLGSGLDILARSWAIINDILQAKEGSIGRVTDNTIGIAKDIYDWKTGSVFGMDQSIFGRIAGWGDGAIAPPTSPYGANPTVYAPNSPYAPFNLGGSETNIIRSLLGDEIGYRRDPIGTPGMVPMPSDTSKKIELHVTNIIQGATDAELLEKYKKAMLEVLRNHQEKKLFGPSSYFGIIGGR